jgi:phage tail sheath protein FI
MAQINETAIKTPGVYVNEIPLFPPTVAQVETAVPAFIGYTEIAARKGENLVSKAVKVKSLVEFESYYGKGPEMKVTRVDLDVNNNVTNVEMTQEYFLYDSIRIFFLNGGGKCYIISVGTGYPAGGISKQDIENAIKLVLAKEDEPTLILFPDAVKLGATDFHFLQNVALKQCNDLQDRFTICDLGPSTDSPSWQTSVDSFRNNIDLTFMNYGAAYTPYLRTNLSKNITFRTIQGSLFKFGTGIQLSDLVPSADGKMKALIQHLDDSIKDQNEIKNRIKDTIYEEYQTLLQVFKTASGKPNPVPADVKNAYLALYNFVYEKTDKLIDDLADNPTNILHESIPPTPPSTETINFVLASIRKVIVDTMRTRMKTLNSYNKSHKVLTDVDDKLYTTKTWEAAEWTQGGVNVMDDAVVVFDNSIYPHPNDLTGDANKENKFIENMVAAEPKITQVMKDLYSSLIFIKQSAAFIESSFERTLFDSFSLYRAINLKVASTATELPPSGAIAGIYAQTDAIRGVWKAPANVNITGVESLSYTIDNVDNDSLNVSETGKSINAIRFFTGKGNLVWGARTVDGNSSEWRYISVRRFFIMVEESAKKATLPFVFEPNDANTWVKIRAMLENYLTLLWRQGALAGAKPEHAFFVKCGLGQTMTAQDILDGKLIVEIGMAAVRPAEFIILRFSHKLQQS